jgi:hypothetical protein
MTSRETRRAKAKARTALFAALADVVDLSTLEDGDDEFDYFVDVPLVRFGEIADRIAEIVCDVNVRFGVWVRVLPIGRST